MILTIPVSYRTWEEDIQIIIMVTTWWYKDNLEIDLVNSCLGNSAFNKHRWPTKSVGYFAQRRWLLFSLNLSN